MTMLISMLFAASTLIAALFNFRRRWVLLSGIGISVMPLLFEMLVVGPRIKMHETAVAWLLWSPPVYACLCYLCFVLTSSRIEFRRTLLIATVVLAAGLWALDSRYYVEFRDREGRPFSGGIVEMNYSSWWWGEAGPPYPKSDENGIAYVGLMRASLGVHAHVKGAVADNGWPKKAVH